MKKYVIKLSLAEREALAVIVRRQNVAAQKKLRAQILLATDQGEHGPAKTDLTITRELPVSKRTIEHLRAWACEAGPAGPLERRPPAPGDERKLDGSADARLIPLP